MQEALGAQTTDKLLGEASAGVHLRPYAHDSLLLLWEYWHGDWAVSEPPALGPNGEVELDSEMFPEVCVRGLSKMVPGLEAYIGNIPRSTIVDGGYYTETPELLPLVGPVAGSGCVRLPVHLSPYCVTENESRVIPHRYDTMLHLILV